MGCKTGNQKKVATMKQNRLRLVTRAVERAACKCKLSPRTCGFRGSGKLCLKQFAVDQGGYHPNCKGGG